MRSSRATSRAQVIAGPSSGSAPAAGRPATSMQCHFSGSTTSRAPSAAARRTSRSATSALRAASGPEVSWTAATRSVASPGAGPALSSALAMS